MNISQFLDPILERIGNDLKALANRIGFLERSLHYLTPPVSTVRSDSDANGVYRLITYTGADGRTIKTSQLENDPMLPTGVNPYNKRVDVVYTKAGNTSVVSYHVQYDANGTVVSETLIP